MIRPVLPPTSYGPITALFFLGYRLILIASLIGFVALVVGGWIAARDTLAVPTPSPFQDRR